jgi:hypothetical protein
MPTPNVKLLLHALRLGQPQEPQASLRALAEAATLQRDQIAALEQALRASAEREQALLARIARLEASVATNAARVVAVGPASPKAHAQATDSSAKSARPPIPDVSPDRAPRGRAMLESADEFAGETLIVARNSVNAAAPSGRSNAQAPFAIAPADPSRVPGARQSIPGAPWSSGAKAGVDRPPPIAMASDHTFVPMEESQDSLPFDEITDVTIPSAARPARGASDSASDSTGTSGTGTSGDSK